MVPTLTMLGRFSVATRGAAVPWFEIALVTPISMTAQLARVIPLPPAKRLNFQPLPLGFFAPCVTWRGRQTSLTKPRHPLPHFRAGSAPAPTPRSRSNRHRRRLREILPISSVKAQQLLCVISHNWEPRFPSPLQLSVDPRA